MIIYGDFRFDAFFVLFALLPMAALLAYANVSQVDRICTHALTSIEKLEDTLFALATLQRWSLFERSVRMPLLI